MKLKKKNPSGGVSAGRMMIYMMILLIVAVIAMGLTYGRVALQEAQSAENNFPIGIFVLAASPPFFERIPGIN